VDSTRSRPASSFVTEGREFCNSLLSLRFVTLSERFVTEQTFCNGFKRFVTLTFCNAEKQEFIREEHDIDTEVR